MTELFICSKTRKTGMTELFICSKTRKTGMTELFICSKTRKTGMTVFFGIAEEVYNCERKELYVSNRIHNHYTVFGY